jgi:hypothetical protein
MKHRAALALVLLWSRDAWSQSEVVCGDAIWTRLANEIEAACARKDPDTKGCDIIVPAMKHCSVTKLLGPSDSKRQLWLEVPDAEVPECVWSIYFGRGGDWQYLKPPIFECDGFTDVRAFPLRSVHQRHRDSCGGKMWRELERATEHYCRAHLDESRCQRAVWTMRVCADSDAWVDKNGSPHVSFESHLTENCTYHLRYSKRRPWKLLSIEAQCDDDTT